MADATPVLMIGLDAAEVTLVDRLCAEGKLPTIATLRRKGCSGRLESEATILSGSVWPTFYTSKHVPWHGIYHDRLWHHEKMRFEMVSDAWLPATPFWEMLDRAYRVAIVDVPFVLRRPRSLNGVLVGGWGTHDRVFVGTQPRRLGPELERQCGPPVMSAYARPRTAAEFLALRDQLVATTQQVAQLSRVVLARGPWDVFCVVFGATHRGGHHLWDLSQIEPNTAPAHQAELERALDDVYAACDRAIAAVIEAGAPDARVLVFATHGMGLNPGWNDRFDDILSAAGGRTPARAKAPGARSTSSLRGRVKKVVFPRLPLGMRNYLENRRRTKWFDWSTTRYFPLDMDHAGYVRINLVGREPRGIVRPGSDYRAVCDELADALAQVRDFDTGEAIVERVYRLDELAPDGAPYKQVLPDLVITWADRSAIGSHGVYRAGHGEVRWNGERVLPSLRSGNHRGQGWFVAAGRDIDGGGRAEGHHIVDLVPTVFEWIGERRGQDVHGTPIPALCGRRAESDADREA